jgi:hypothetical protein
VVKVSAVSGKDEPVEGIIVPKVGAAAKAEVGRSRQKNRAKPPKVIPNLDLVLTSGINSFKFYTVAFSKEVYHITPLFSRSFFSVE